MPNNTKTSSKTLAKMSKATLKAEATSTQVTPNQKHKPSITNALQQLTLMMNMIE